MFGGGCFFYAQCAKQNPLWFFIHSSLRSLPAIGLLGSGQGVIKEGVSLVCVVLHLQIQSLLQAEGGMVLVPRRLNVPGGQLDITFTQRARVQTGVTAARLTTLHGAWIRRNKTSNTNIERFNLQYV